jgi:hypothetical protein
MSPELQGSAPARPKRRVAQSQPLPNQDSQRTYTSWTDSSQPDAGAIEDDSQDAEYDPTHGSKFSRRVLVLSPTPDQLVLC